MSAAPPQSLSRIKPLDDPAAWRIHEEPDQPAVDVHPRRAVGHGATEAPRGMLYHRYEIDDDGTILSATIVPPTSQNQLPIEEDLRAVVEQQLDLPDDELRHRCEQPRSDDRPWVTR